MRQQRARIDSAFLCSVYVDSDRVARVGGVAAGPAGMVMNAITAPPGRVEACAEAWFGASYYREC